MLMWLDFVVTELWVSLAWLCRFSNSHVHTVSPDPLGVLGTCPWLCGLGVGWICSSSLCLEKRFVGFVYGIPLVPFLMVGQAREILG